MFYMFYVNLNVLMFNKISTLFVLLLLTSLCSYGQEAGEPATPNLGYLDFDGTNDYVQINNSSVIDFSGDFTLEVKFKRQRLGIREELMDKKELISSTPSQHDVAIYIDNDDKVVFYLGTGTNWLVLKSTTTIDATDWFHVAGVRQGNNAKLYVNGVLEDSGTHTLSSVSNGPLRLGSNRVENPTATAPPTNLFDGTIDEVRMWSLARPLVDIVNNLSNELTGNEAGLMLYYNFNQGLPCGSNPTVTTLIDGTSNATNGALTNFDLTGTLSNPCQSNWSGVWATNLTSLSIDNVTISPNPFLDNINIELPTTINNIEIELINILGTIEPTVIQKNGKRYNLLLTHNVPVGLYFLRLKNEENQVSLKVLKK